MSDYFSNGDTTVTTTFQQTPQMASYLNAFVISDMKNISNAPGHFPHRFFTQEGLLDAAPFGLQHGESALRTLQDYLQVKYPLTKLDQVTIPNLSFPGTNHK